MPLPLPSVGEVLHHVKEIFLRVREMIFVLMLISAAGVIMGDTYPGCACLQTAAELEGRINEAEQQLTKYKELR